MILKVLFKKVTLYILRWIIIRLYVKKLKTLRGKVSSEEKVRLYFALRNKRVGHNSDLLGRLINIAFPNSIESLYTYYSKQKQINRMEFPQEVLDQAISIKDF